MPTEIAVQLALEVLAIAIKEAPEIEALVQDWLKKDNPTLEERATLRSKIALLTYKNLVPDSKLPVDELNKD